MKRMILLGMGLAVAIMLGVGSAGAQLIKTNKISPMKPVETGSFQLICGMPSDPAEVAAINNLSTSSSFTASELAKWLFACSIDDAKQRLERLASNVQWLNGNSNGLRIVNKKLDETQQTLCPHATKSSSDDMACSSYTESPDIATDINNQIAQIHCGLKEFSVVMSRINQTRNLITSCAVEKQ